jgi:hypothetical protein
MILQNIDLLFEFKFGSGACLFLSPASCSLVLWLMWLLRVVILCLFVYSIPAPKYNDCGDDEDEEDRDEYIHSL